MPSKSLVSSWTASFVPSATRAPRSPHEAHHEKKISASHPRLPVLKHLHVLWKGMGVSSPGKSQLFPSDPMLRPVSPTINRSAGAATLTSRLTPTACHPLDLPSPPSPSPTTPAPASLLSGGVDTGSLVITASQGEIGSMFSRRAFLLPVPESRSPVLPPADPEPSRPELCSSSGGRKRVPSISTCLSGHLPLSSPSSYGDTSISSPPRLAASGSGSALDAATRLRDFRALIAEMRAAPDFRDDLKEQGEQGFDAGHRNNVDNDNGDDNDEERGERERVLRLLEDVVRNVKLLGLRRNDAAGWGHFVNRDRRSSLGRQSSTLPCLSGENVKCSQVTI